MHGSKSSKQGPGAINPSFPGKRRKEAMEERLYLDEARWMRNLPRQEGRGDVPDLQK